MDELPELPFEKVLSYLNLADRLKARTISRAWRNTFDRYPVNTLCYSSRPSDFIWGKSRWVSGVFAENFINSTRFASFFDTFGQTFLSNLKHLRLCELDLSEEDLTTFAGTLNSFSQLEQLDIIRAEFNLQVFKLNLPMLTSLQLEYVYGIKNLILYAPRLREVRHQNLYRKDFKVKIVHGKSVKKLLVNCWSCTKVKKLKNLQYLCIANLSHINPTFLPSLQHLKEIHTNDPELVSKLFEQKQRSGRADLKIYLCGLLLNGPDDPAINALRSALRRGSDPLSREWLVCLAENPTRRADVIPSHHLRYRAIESVAPDVEVDLLKRFTDLYQVIVESPIQNIQRFLDLLKNFKNIVWLTFWGCAQPQDLFDRMPEHCAVQTLILKYSEPSDLGFLFRLKHLIHLKIDWSIDSETVRRAFEELPALSSFKFEYDRKRVSIEIDQSKQFQVSFGDREKKTIFDLNAAIEYIFANENATIEAAPINLTNLLEVILLR